MVQKIKKDGSNKLDILILPGEISVVDIPKAMIFLDNINVRITIVRYLRRIFPVSMQDKKKTVIIFFNFNYEANITSSFIEDFQRRNTRIMICMDAARISINIPDVARAIQ